MTDTPESISKSLKTYLIIGLILFAGTAVTVLVATRPELDVGKHGFDSADCILGISIASVKAFLVSWVFMHLNHEKKMVYFLFGSGICMVLSLFLLTALAMNDPIVDPFFNSGY
jgi:caa(3)-type oxidase subunit IV